MKCRRMSKLRIVLPSTSSGEPLLAGAVGKQPAFGDKVQLAFSKGTADKAHTLANGSVARDAQPLTQVTFIEGDEKEHLGELDLNQLDSFR